MTASWTAPKTWAAEVLTSSDFNTHLRDNLEFLKVNIALGAAAALTISGGVVTATQSYHKIAGEGAAADNLDTIGGGAEGIVIAVRPNGQVITLKHLTGNLAIGSDVVLAHDYDHMLLIYGADSLWHRFLTSTHGGSGSMYLHENATAYTIQESTMPCALHGFTVGQLDGWTHKAGQSITVTAWATSDAGAKTKLTTGATAPDLANGDIITICNTTSYDGTYIIEQVVADTSCVIAKAYVADEGSKIVHAACYLTHSTFTGTVRVAYTMSATPATAGDVFEFEAYHGLTELVESESQIKLGSGGDYSCASSFCNFAYTAGGKVWVKVENIGAARNLTIRNANVSVQGL
jgi:hypothetical protein